MDKILPHWTLGCGCTLTRSSALLVLADRTIHAVIYGVLRAPHPSLVGWRMSACSALRHGERLLLAPWLRTCPWEFKTVEGLDHYAHALNQHKLLVLG